MSLVISGDETSLKSMPTRRATCGPGGALIIALLLGCQGALSDSAGAVSMRRPHPVISEMPSVQRAAGEMAESAQVINLDDLPNLSGIIEELERKRLVFVGENHDRFEHHLVQLAIISGLHERNSALAIGMEFFQVPFQRYLDDYVAGRLDDEALLAATEYFERWGFDFRLYQPILRYAQENGIPLVALNASKELVAKVSDHGIKGLGSGDKAKLPADMAPADAHYRERLRSIFELHSGSEARDFERFVEVQLLWDESMAQTVAHYLRAHPERSLVVLAGNGHLAFRWGIPERVQRRLKVDTAVILNGAENGIEPHIADYVVLPEQRDLPAAGRMEVLLDASADRVSIKSLNTAGAAAVAGIKAGDALLTVGGRPIRTLADIKIALWDRLPGERVSVHVRRHRRFFGQEDRAFEVELR